jgi:hypothetical protein
MKKTRGRKYRETVSLSIVQELDILYSTVLYEQLRVEKMLDH